MRRNKPVVERKRPRRHQRPREASDIGYSTREFAHAARISVAMLYKLWREHRGPPYKQIGRRRIIDRDGGLEWLRADQVV
jgi:hypothetical protein